MGIEETKKVLVGKINNINFYHTDAYAIAVRNGFDGTEEEWLESLKDPMNSVAVEFNKAEAGRVAAEGQRVIAESGRAKAESERASAEAKRVESENTRATSESERVTNEEARVQAEAARAVVFEGWTDGMENLHTYDSRINKHEKQITVLEAAVYGDLAQEVENSEVAYIKDVPASALPAAKVSMIGGMTRKCANLITTRSTATMSGVTATVSDDGTITFSGTTTAGYNYYLYSSTLPAGTYYISWNGVVSGANHYVFDETDSKVIAINDQAFSLSAEHKIIVYVNCTIVGKALSGSIRPMLNAGSTALPYEPYFEGLRSAPETEVESDGANLLPLEDKEMTVLGCTVKVVSGVISVTGQATGSGGRLNAISGVTLTAGTYVFSSADGNFFLSGDSGSGEIIGTVSSPFVLTEETRLILGFNFSEGRTYSVSTTAHINRGTERLPYTPYQHNTLPIPAEVRAKDGYGDGINKDVNNHIRYEDDGKRTWNRRVGKVDLGTLDWERFADGGYGVFRCNVSDRRNDADILCPKYSKNTTANTANDLNDFEIFVSGTSTYLYFKNTSYTDAETFKAAMSGVMLYYELAEPITEDISDILPADNYIEVEGGGTLTFTNEYEYDVPSEVTFVTKEVSA